MKTTEFVQLSYLKKTVANWKLNKDTGSKEVRLSYQFDIRIKLLNLII